MKYNAGLELDRDNTLAKMIKRMRAHSTVLEFGPANGRMTRYLHEEMGCHIYAVEIDAEAAKDCEKYTEKLLVGDIEKYEWVDLFGDVAFDYIVFADVLEHLYDPKQVLQMAKRLLKQDGSIFLSVPNLAHNSILINLLNNKLEYTKIGLLDDTHIRFFTYHSLIALCYELDLVPSLEDACYSQVGNNEVRAAYTDVSPEIETALRGRQYANVYQFVFELRLKESMEENQIRIDKRIKPYFALPYHTQVFFDRGQGFQESDCSIFPLGRESYQELLLLVGAGETLSGIRIDPADIPILFSLKQFTLLYEDGQECALTGENLFCNADYQIGDWYVFLHSDPQLYLKETVTLSKLERVRMVFAAIDLRTMQHHFNQSGFIYRTLQELEKEKVALQQEKQDLYEKMSMTYAHLQDNYVRLQDNYVRLQEAYEKMNLSYQTLQRSFWNRLKMYLKRKMGR